RARGRPRGRTGGRRALRHDRGHPARRALRGPRAAGPAAVEGQEGRRADPALEHRHPGQCATGGGPSQRRGQGTGGGLVLRARAGGPGGGLPRRRIGATPAATPVTTAGRATSAVSPDDESPPRTPGARWALGAASRRWPPRGSAGPARGRCREVSELVDRLGARRLLGGGLVGVDDALAGGLVELTRGGDEQCAGLLLVARRGGLAQ